MRLKIWTEQNIFCIRRTILSRRRRFDGFVLSRKKSCMHHDDAVMTSSLHHRLVPVLRSKNPINNDSVRDVTVTSQWVWLWSQQTSRSTLICGTDSGLDRFWRGQEVDSFLDGFCLAELVQTGSYSSTSWCTEEFHHHGNTKYQLENGF